MIKRVALVSCVFSWSTSLLMSSPPVHPVHNSTPVVFYFMRTLYEPDTAFSLETGKMNIELGWLRGNFSQYSVNTGVDGVSIDAHVSFKHCIDLQPGDPPNYNWDCKSEGYSIYHDGEFDRIAGGFSLGIGYGLELQLMTRHIRFFEGNLDRWIERFHENTGRNNAKRVTYPRNDFNILVFDNQHENLVFSFKTPMEQHLPESHGIALKWKILANAQHALAVKWTSNFQDHLLEYHLNQLPPSEPVKDFDDYNISLVYSFQEGGYALHLATAQTIMSQPVFANTKKQWITHFIGGVLPLSETWNMPIQILYYESLFRNDERENLSEGLFDATIAFRKQMKNFQIIEFGITDTMNYSPLETDAVFFLKWAMNVTLF
ncbi:MAG: DUF3187 family protein [SAR324 cluster bacterium]|nr:DUF3187 family protein [SAR324 cluster bacterium]